MLGKVLKSKWGSWQSEEVKLKIKQDSFASNADALYSIHCMALTLKHQLRKSQILRNLEFKRYLNLT